MLLYIHLHVPARPISNFVPNCMRKDMGIRANMVPDLMSTARIGGRPLCSGTDPEGAWGHVPPRPSKVGPVPPPSIMNDLPEHVPGAVGLFLPCTIYDGIHGNF